MNVILSLKPKYSEAILVGKKRYEFRRRIFKRKDIEKVFIYTGDGIRGIVGFFEIEDLLSGTPDVIWSICGRYGAISRKEFFNYFEGADRAYAIKIGKTTRFQQPIDPNIFIDNFSPPQNFRYFAGSFCP